MTAHRVLVVDTDFPDLVVERDAGAASGLEFVVLDPGQSLVDLPADVAGSVTALLMQWRPIDAAAMDRFSNLQAIGRIGLGVDLIDVDDATRRGVAVVNSGDYATEEVAAHTIALLLAVARRITVSDRAVRNGTWFDPAHFAGVPRLSELTLGLVGLGRIGARVAMIAASLGMTVIAFDPFAPGADVELVPDLDDLLRRTDVLSLHVPLTPDTKALIGLPELRALKPGAIVVNTSRGGLLDAKAVVTAIREGTLSGAGLDVFEEEPLPPGHPIVDEDRVVLSPHSAYYSERGSIEARRRPVEGIAAVLAGTCPANQVNDVEPRSLSGVAARPTTP